MMDTADTSTRQGTRSLPDLEELLSDISTRWYAHKLLARGMLASYADWDEKLHPRGKDGKFIHKFGWVKWLALDGLWHRGSVEFINPKTGGIQVREKSGFSTLFDDGKKLIALPNPKAALDVPNLKTGHVPKGWVKVGGQTGSNTGGLFENAYDVGKLVAIDDFKEAGLLDGLVETAKSATMTFPDDGYTHSQGVVHRSVGGILRDLDTGKVIPDQKAILDNHGRIDMEFPKDTPLPRPRAKNIEALAKELPNAGEKFYVKNLKSPEHAQNELLANRLYELAGVPVPEVHAGTDPSSIASKIIPGDKVSLKQATPEQLSAIRRDYAVDAWLSNWDTVGLELDNILIADGVPTRIDAGGSLRYRAQGAPKGHLFTSDVTELDSLKNPSINPQSAHIFGGVTDEELLDGASRVAAINPLQIDQVVKDLGIDQDLADTLIARRADLIARTGVKDPWMAATSVDLDDDVMSPFGDGKKIKAVLDESPTHIDLGPEIEELLTPPVSKPNPYYAGDNNNYGGPENDPLGPGPGKSIEEQMMDAADEYKKANSNSVDTDTSLDDAIDYESTGLIKYDDDIANLEPELSPNLHISWSLPISELDEDHDYDKSKPYVVQTVDSKGNKTFALAELISVNKSPSSGLNEVVFKPLRSGHTPHDPNDEDKSDSVYFEYASTGAIAQMTDFDVDQFSKHSIIDLSPTQDANTDNPWQQIRKNGVIIGRLNHIPTGDGDYNYQVHIYDGSSLTGKEEKSGVFAYKNLALQDLISTSAPNILHVKPKTTESNALKAAIKDAADSPTSPVAKKLLDDVDAVVGQQVISTNDGTIGKIVGFAPAHPNYVYVQPLDGSKKKLRSLNTLKSNDPIPVEVPAGPYAHLSTSDGKVPAIGQTVKAGKGAKQIEGKVTKINPTKGWVFVEPTDGSKGLWKTLGTTTVVSGADPLNELSPAVSAAAAVSVKKPSTKPAATAFTLAKYAGPDGATISQSDAVKQKWLAGSPKRKLTVDGYVPVTGMNVVDTDGKEYIVAKTFASYQSTPNSVRLYSPSEKKYYTKAASKLYVDHGKELYNSDGQLIPTVSGISGDVYEANIPEGSTLYKVVTPPNWRHGNTTTVYYYTKPHDPKMWKVFPKQYGGHTQSYDFQKAGNWSISKYYPNADMPVLTKVAYIGDKNTNKKLVIAKTDDYSYKNQLNIETAVDSHVDDGIAINKAKAAKIELNAAKSEAVAKFYENSDVQPPDVVDELQKAKALSVTNADINTKQMKPTDAPISPSGSSTTLPVVTGGVGSLDTVDPSISTANSHSVLSAALATIEHKEDKSNKGLLYGVGDSTYVEDLGFRTQVIKHKDGSESLEVRFRLLPDATHGLAKSLLTTGGEKGYWTSSSVTNPNDLKPGDRVDVRLSSSIGSLKPGNQGINGVPNATVSGDPDFVGVNTKGLEVWRVPVITQTGVADFFYAEKRDAPSINTYAWDPDKSVPGHNNVTLSPEAQAYGWSRTAGMYAPYSNSGVHVDENGTGLDTGDKKRISQNGNYLEKTDSDGVKHIVNIVDVSEGGTTQNQNSNGEVRIRLPIDGGEVDKEQFAKVLSRALEEVGVPVEAQQPSTPDDLKSMAISKLYANFNPKYNKNVTDIKSLDDKRVKDTLDHMSKTLKEKGGLKRDVTLDDLFIHTHETGRVQVLLSPEVAKAITKSQGNTYYSHSEATHSVDNIERIIAGATSGLQSTDERWSSGIMINGMSSSTDMGLGSGDRIYMHGKVGELKHSAQYHSVQIIFNPVAIAQSTEIYANQSDAYGRRKGTNNYITMGNAHEYMYKRKIEPEQIGYVMVPASMRDTLLERLKKRGIYKIGGRDVGAVIVSGSSTIPPVKSDLFQSVGVVTPNGPSVPSFPSAPSGPASIPVSVPSVPAAPSAPVAV